MSNYTNSYVPTDLVNGVHNLPHLNARLAVQSSTFDISYDSLWNDYTKSLLPLPLICMSLGLLAVIIFQISLCCRACVPLCKCLPTIDVVQPSQLESTTLDQTVNQTPTIPFVRYLYILFFVFTALAIGADQSIIFGSNDLVDGVETSNNALEYVEDLFNGLVFDGNSLVANGNELSTLFTEAVNSGCEGAQDLIDQMPLYFQYVGEYQSYVDPVPGQCSTASDELSQYGTEYKNSSMWSLYGSVLFGTALFLVGLFLKSTLTLQLSVGFVQLLMIALFILCGVEMVILMGLADFCMDPATYVQLVVPTDVSSITSYYVTCSGINPMEPSIASAEELVASSEEYVNALLSGSCQNNVYLQQSLVVLGDVDYVYANITSAIACPPTQTQFLEVLNTGLCDQSFRGFYIVWVGQFLSTSCLFVAAVAIALLYQFFNPHWDVKPHQQQKRNSRGSNNLLFMEQDPDSSATATSPNEFYYNTSTLHTSGEYPAQNNLVSSDDVL